MPIKLKMISALIHDDLDLDIFCDIKLVLMQGSSLRSKILAQDLAEIILGISRKFYVPVNLFKESSPFVAYKIGKILVVSHGMGPGSFFTLLRGLTKLMQLTNNDDLQYIRLGTSGGLGVDAGVVVLTESVYTPNLVSGIKLTVLGHEQIYPTVMNKELNQAIIAAQPSKLGFDFCWGNTIAAEDFYLGQSRMDGAIKPWFSLEQRQEYFKQVRKLNILNFEMESHALAHFGALAKIPATMIAVTIVGRSNGDQITSTADELMEFSERTKTVAINYIRACGLNNFV